MNFAAIATGARSRDEMRTHVFLEALARGTKPYVAAVNGLAVGVGVTMLMHCDVTYVAEDARLMTPFVNLALVPEAASSWLIPARIGYARAFQLFAFGEPMDGKTAAAIGLVTAAVPAAEVRAKALAASGILDSVLALIALRHGVVPGVATLRELDPDLGNLPVSARPQAPRSDVALVLNRGFGGSNTALVLRAAASDAP